MLCAWSGVKVVRIVRRVMMKMAILYVGVGVKMAILYVGILYVGRLDAEHTFVGVEYARKTKCFAYIV